MMEAKKAVNMTFDELSMEHSKGFVMALQELKNLRPQLYSAAEYCEKSYLHNEQKQMVLDNLKDYAVRALVNAVDHLGTVASKLTEVIEQQSSEVSSMELKVSCVKQKLLICQTYTSNEGLRQQQLLATPPKLHKRYVLPNSAFKKVHFNPHVQIDSRQTPLPRFQHQPSASPLSNSLSWHLAADSKSSLKSSSSVLSNAEDPKSSVAFPIHDKPERTQARPYGNTSNHSAEFRPSNQLMDSSGVPMTDVRENPRPLTAFRSFGWPRHEMPRAPVRSRSMLSAFFVKHKNSKLKPGAVS